MGVDVRCVFCGVGAWGLSLSSALWMITGGTLSLEGVCSGICGGSLGIILARRAAHDQFFWDVDFVGLVRADSCTILSGLDAQFL
jgi:hypothetical protein